MLSPEKLGQRVRELREERKLSQQELGEALNPKRTYATVSDIERGVTRLTYDDLTTLARFFGKTVSDLIQEEPAQTTPSFTASRCLHRGRVAASSSKRSGKLLRKVRLKKESKAETAIVGTRRNFRKPTYALSYEGTPWIRYFSPERAAVRFVRDRAGSSYIEDARIVEVTAEWRLGLKAIK